MSEPVSPAGEVERLREELDLSRRELAAARGQLEQALEELAVERARLVAGPADPADGASARPAVLGRLADRLRRPAP